MAKEIDLSIVIISSKKDFLLDCLGSIKQASSGIDLEIIVVDNASADKVGAVAKDKFPEVVVIRREENGGFGENNNLGMRMAKGKYALLLNTRSVFSCSLAPRLRPASPTPRSCVRTSTAPNCNRPP